MVIDFQNPRKSYVFWIFEKRQWTKNSEFQPNLNVVNGNKQIPKLYQKKSYIKSLLR